MEKIKELVRQLDFQLECCEKYKLNAEEGYGHLRDLVNELKEELTARECKNKNMPSYARCFRVPQMEVCSKERIGVK